MVNGCLEAGVFPEKWKIAKLALLPKEGENPQDPSAHRPICLLPVWGKVLDKALTARLTYYMDENNLISPQQYGFRKNRSTVDAINKITVEVEENKKNRNPTCLIALDISNAFNTVNWNILITKLHKYKTPSYLVRMISSFLRNRKITIEDLITT